MNSRRIFAACAVLAAGLAIVTPPLGARTDASAPLLEKQMGSNPAAKPGAKIWLKAEVIHADIRSLVVREQNDARMIHTFTYAPAAQSEMRTIMAQGGYRYGDKVKILYQEGQTVALEIYGKPSKPH